MSTTSFDQAGTPHAGDVQPVVVVNGSGRKGPAITRLVPGIGAATRSTAVRAPIALLAGAALVLPTVMVASPAKAYTDAPSNVLNCQTTKRDVTVRVKLRAEKERGFTRIRVSHPRGTGNFDNPRVRSTSAEWGQIGSAVCRPRRGSSTVRAASVPYENPVRDRATFRVPAVGDGFSVNVKFTLRDGTHIRLFCGFQD
jgi:hypothetical protein